jgi:hypothetical protein
MIDPKEFIPLKFRRRKICEDYAGIITADGVKGCNAIDNSTYMYMQGEVL